MPAPHRLVHVIAARSSRRLVACGGVLAIVVAGGLGVPVSAAASDSGVTAAGTPGTHYAVMQPLCEAVAGSQARCYAMRRVAVPKGTTGAETYVVRSDSYETGPAGGYTPDDLKDAYGFDPAAATSQTVAVIEAYDDPNAEADLDHFDAEYGLPSETATSFRKVGQDGSATLPVADATGDWSGEESLDIEAVRAVCNACKILVVEATTDSSDNLGAAENTAASLGADVINNSFGFPETDSELDVGTASDYYHPGIVITAATGDDGWYDWDDTNLTGGVSSDAPSFPSSLPEVVGVGGTTLHLYDDGSRANEYVWNSNGADDEFGYLYASVADSAAGATGGGCSTEFTATSWQSHVAGYSSTGCDGARLPTDISADGDPDTGFDVYDSYDPFAGQANDPGAPGWSTIGGTSLSSAIIAGMWGLAGGAHGVAFPSLTLYGHSQDSALYDVVRGSNGFCGGDDPIDCQDTIGDINPNELAVVGNNNEAAGLTDCMWDADGNRVAADTQCVAAKGYDGPSGLGAPNGLKPFAIAALKAAVHSTKTITVKKKTSFSDTDTDPYPGATVSYAWSFGDGSTGRGHGVSHTFRRTGHFTVGVTATDSYGHKATATKTVTVKKAKKKK